MMVSYSGNAHGQTLTNYTTFSKTYTQNKIHFGTQHKKTIFIHPHKTKMAKSTQISNKKSQPPYNTFTSVVITPRPATQHKRGYPQ